MGLPGTGIKKTIRRFATTHEIRGNAQEDGYYNDDGIFVRGSRDPEYIKLHHQPLSGKEALNVPENLRSKDIKKYWTVEIDKIDIKKQVVINNIIYSIETIETFTSHSEGMMSRSGTKQGLNE